MTCDEISLRSNFSDKLCEYSKSIVDEINLLKEECLLLKYQYNELIASIVSRSSSYEEIEEGSDTYVDLRKDICSLGKLLLRIKAIEDDIYELSVVRSNVKSSKASDVSNSMHILNHNKRFSKVKMVKGIDCLRGMISEIRNRLFK